VSDPSNAALWMQLSDERDALRARVERYEQALKRIGYTKNDSWWAQQARAALEGQDG
jgi:hypothetical protein